MNLRATCLLPLALLLGSCAGGPGRQPPAPVETPPPADGGAVPAPPPPVSAAFSGLLERARAARKEGATERALVLLERAQRLDPARGALYLELALTHRAAGDEVQARAFAERGLLYCLGSECDELARLAR